MKRLIICCDGTWNTPDQRAGEKDCPTNVVKIARAVRARSDTGTHQIVYYSRGVGTRPGIDRFTGGAFGHGLATNVQDAYRFIVDNYADGDEIFLFGFSRGAYTARSVVGFIRNSGVLRRDTRHLFREAYELYRRDDLHPDDDEARKFRADHSHEVRIKFLGVWDTVGALGIPVRSLNWLTRKKYEFHDVQLSRIVDHACHAVAIDEKRSQFKPALWETTPEDAHRVEQTWFAGVHSNVGGGYPDAGLSDIALKWMLERAQAHGLQVDAEYVQENLLPDIEGTLENSFKGMYRLSRPYQRPIPASALLHETVHRRHTRESPSYAPPNLLAYLQSVAQPSDRAPMA
jgi:uncharacterized protein (DUF2235 family)